MLGNAQQLATRFMDSQAQSILNSVPSMDPAGTRPVPSAPVPAKAYTGQSAFQKPPPGTAVETLPGSPNARPVGASAPRPYNAALWMPPRWTSRRQADPGQLSASVASCSCTATTSSRRGSLTDVARRMVWTDPRRGTARLGDPTAGVRDLIAPPLVTRAP